MYVTADCTENERLTQAQLVLTRNGRAVFLRPARPDDAAELAQIHQQAVAGDNRCDRQAASYRDLIMSPGARDLYLVAEYHRKVVGALFLRCARLAIRRHQAMLEVELQREFRGTGLGGALIQRAINWAREQGIELIYLSVPNSNPRARLMYERMGFCAEAYAADIGETRMVLHLTS